VHGLLVPASGMNGSNGFCVISRRGQAIAKNPHSHRTVNLTDAREAQEMVVHASHLLRIVEDRAAKRKQGP
jgi:hypothetical protein